MEGNKLVKVLCSTWFLEMAKEAIESWHIMVAIYKSMTTLCHQTKESQESSSTCVILSKVSDSNLVMDHTGLLVWVVAGIVRSSK